MVSAWIRSFDKDLTPRSVVVAVIPVRFHLYYRAHPGVVAALKPVITDGKPGYLADTPRFLAYARSVAERYSELRIFLPLLDLFQDRSTRTTYTF